MTELTKKELLNEGIVYVSGTMVWCIKNGNRRQLYPILQYSKNKKNPFYIITLNNKHYQLARVVYAWNKGTTGLKDIIFIDGNHENLNIKNLVALSPSMRKVKHSALKQHWSREKWDAFIELEKLKEEYINIKKKIKKTNKKFEELK